MYSASYFPILRAKPGEIAAIGQLSPLARVRIRPIFDIPVPQKNAERSLTEHLAETVRGIKLAWGTKRPVLIDLSRYAPDINLGDGRHPVEFVFDYARQSRLKAIPMAGPLSVRGPEHTYVKAVADIANRDHLGAGIRIPFEDFLSPTKLLQVLELTLQSVALSDDQCDLILDAEALERHSLTVDPVSTLHQIFKVATVALADYRFRSVILCGSSVPANFGPQYNTAPYRTERVEFNVWRKLLVDPTLPLAIFGDYGPVPPFQTDADNPVRPPSRIRLSTRTEHVFYRAPRKDHQTLCREVMESPAAYMQAPSWGMNATRACGAGSGGIGTPCTWIARDTNAHIETTVNEIDQELRRAERISDLKFDEPEASPWHQDVLELI